ncbi:arabinofuranosyltransferase [Hamadaea tsunoensis]|uniref:arabinofuranosyltransferase n=1 Tax=Hamadaea tsunoensis TaxID=53368 RepID=UPI00041CEA8E|nr:arabinofuranosyltransferase [Hamadaea tsunoensis]
MQTVGLAEPAAAPSSAEPAENPPTPRTPWWRSSAATAIVTWLIAVPVAFVVPKVLKLNPISVHGAIMPMLALIGGLTVLAIVWLRRPIGEAVTGIAAGLLAAWFVLLGRAMLYGTPFGYEGMEGDAKRIVALALRYSTTVMPVDAVTKGVPAEYPPLFAWLVGRGSVLTGVPPYHLIAYAQVLTVSFAVLAAFLLWRRMVPSVAALCIAGVTLIGQSDAAKAYELISLFVVVPWILLTFAKPPRGRLHWLPAGIIGGLMVLNYQGYFVFAVFAVLYFMYSAWRTAEHRWAEVRRWIFIAVTAFVVASWYLVPYIHGTLTLPAKMTSDTLEAPDYIDNPIQLPFLSVAASSVLLVAGLVGIVWFFRQQWWARSLGVLLIGTGLFYVLAELRFMLSGHNMFAHYSVRLVAEVLAVAGVLTLAEWLRAAAGRFDAVRVRSTAIILISVYAVLIGQSYWQGWKPTTVPNVHNPRVNLDVEDLNPADAPLTEPLPDGSMPKFANPAARAQKWLPVWQIRDAVERVYGPGYKPTVLTVDEKLFAYLPWYVYAQPAGMVVSGTFAQGPRREAAVDKLAAQTDPAEFARMAGNLDLGPIDAFILKVDPDGKWRWRGATRFDPKVFSDPSFEIVHVANDYVVVIRKP